MAVGRPVVAFALRETRETAADTAAYAVDDTPESFAEAIDSLLASPDEREQREPLEGNGS